MQENTELPIAIVAEEPAAPTQDASESRCVGIECINYVGPEVCGCIAIRNKVRIEPVPE